MEKQKSYQQGDYNTHIAYNSIRNYRNCCNIYFKDLWCYIIKMRIKSRDKRAGIVWQVLIPLIVLIVVGAILFFFLSAIPWRETVDREACHQSVLLRGNAFLKGEWGAELPLKCKTEEIVIKTDDSLEIKRTIANAMYDCWWMLGEGEVDFFRQDPALQKKSHCVICATIGFDEKTKNSLPKITGMNGYLQTTKVPGEEFTYWQYFVKSENPTILNDFEEDYLDTSKTYAITYSLIEKSTLLNCVAGGGAMVVGAKAGAAIGTVIFPGVGTAIGFVGGMVIGGVGGYIIGDKLTNKISGTPEGYSILFTLVPFESRSISEIGCTSIESIP